MVHLIYRWIKEIDVVEQSDEMTNNHNIPSEINKVESEESTLYIGLTTTSPN